MTSPNLTPTERELFNQLIQHGTTLVTVCNNAATVLSEEFESMITGPAGALKSVLDQCPPVVVISWDGVFREEDCDITYYTPDVPDTVRDGRINSGVKMIHRPTGIGREAAAYADQERNRATVLRALRSATEQYYRAAGGDNSRDALH